VLKLAPPFFSDTWSRFFNMGYAPQGEAVGNGTPSLRHMGQSPKAVGRIWPPILLPCQSAFSLVPSLKKRKCSCLPSGSSTRFRPLHGSLALLCVRTRMTSILFITFFQPSGPLSSTPTKGRNMSRLTSALPGPWHHPLRLFLQVPFLQSALCPDRASFEYGASWRMLVQRRFCSPRQVWAT